ncbi:MAG: glycosyltransferase family 4 protein [Deltaproteobacteria bacterium]|nr:glycosyltransferase family 4 protein [Deltaproteobacteria bacterium]
MVAVIGSLYRIKGHALLLSALPRILKSIPALRVAFIGAFKEPDVEEELRALAEPFGRAVVFTGFRADVQELLPAVDVLAVPSHYEGLSLTLCEAMACGIPAVATRVGGNPEVIDHGLNGLLVPPRDPDALADAIVSLFGDDELRRRLGTAARQTIIDRFSIATMVSRYTDLYDELLRIKKPRPGEV